MTWLPVDDLWDVLEAKHAPDWDRYRPAAADDLEPAPQLPPARGKRKPAPRIEDALSADERRDYLSGAWLGERAEVAS